jgi:hypothetical protein
MSSLASLYAVSPQEQARKARQRDRLVADLDEQVSAKNKVKQGEAAEERNEELGDLTEMLTRGINEWGQPLVPNSPQERFMRNRFQTLMQERNKAKGRGAAGSQQDSHGGRGGSQQTDFAVSPIRRPHQHTHYHHSNSDQGRIIGSISMPENTRYTPPGARDREAGHNSGSWDTPEAEPSYPVGYGTAAHLNGESPAAVQNRINMMSGSGVMNNLFGREPLGRQQGRGQQQGVGPNNATRRGADRRPAPLDDIRAEMDREEAELKAKLLADAAMREMREAMALHSPSMPTPGGARGGWSGESPTQPSAVSPSQQSPRSRGRQYKEYTSPSQHKSSSSSASHHAPHAIDPYGQHYRSSARHDDDNDDDDDGRGGGGRGGGGIRALAGQADSRDGGGGGRRQHRVEFESDRDGGDGDGGGGGGGAGFHRLERKIDAGLRKRDDQLDELSRLCREVLKEHTVLRKEIHAVSPSKPSGNGSNRGGGRRGRQGGRQGGAQNKARRRRRWVDEGRETGHVGKQAVWSP